jgi:hypothetical protein
MVIPTTSMIQNKNVWHMVEHGPKFHYWVGLVANGGVPRSVFVPIAKYAPRSLIEPHFLLIVFFLVWWMLQIWIFFLKLRSQYHENGKCNNIKVLGSFVTLIVRGGALCAPNRAMARPNIYFFFIFYRYIMFYILVTIIFKLKIVLSQVVM